MFRYEFTNNKLFFALKMQNKNNKNESQMNFSKVEENQQQQNIDLKLVYCVRSVYCVFFDSIIGLFILKCMLWHLFFKRINKN